jgi:DNA repair protein RadC
MKKKAVEYSITAKKQDFETTKVHSSEDAASFARNFYHEDMLIYESSFIILMNASGSVIGYAKISQGGVCGTYIDPRIVAKYAIDTLASSVILVHNHPSGSTHPSIEDKSIAEKLRNGLKFLGVKLHDSIILTESGYYSMADEGILY